MGTNTILDDLPTYSVLEFLATKFALTIKGEESWKSASLPPSMIMKISAKLNLVVNLNQSH